MKVAVYGAMGRMGQLLSDHLVEHGHDVIQVDPQLQQEAVFASLEVAPKSDVIIDFSHPSWCETVLTYALNTHTPLVIACTGHNDAQFKRIEEASQALAIFKSANLSVGVYVFEQMLKAYTHLLEETYDIEIHETHHKHKVDAPSGTAWLLANAIEEGSQAPKTFITDRAHQPTLRQNHEVGLSVHRGGSVVGEHTVAFYGDADTLKITHQAHTKNLFVQGALLAASYLKSQAPGLYTMHDMMEERRKTL